MDERGSKNWAATGRQRWGAVEARAVLAAWRQSGQSVADFADSHGLQIVRLQRWQARLKDEAQSPVRFAPVTVRPTAVVSPVVVTLGAGLRLEVHELTGASAAWVGVLVRTVQGGDG